MGSWMTLFHQIQLEKDLNDDLDGSSYSGIADMIHKHEPILLLAIVVISAPNNFDLRDTLRSTWLRLNPSKKDSSSSVRHYFVVGTEGLDSELMRRLSQEQTVQGDMILMRDLKDSYNNLTLKVVSSFAHIATHAPAKFILKCDDDSFVRVDEIVRELQVGVSQSKETGGGGGDTILGSKCFYWGFFDGRARVQRKGKWKEEEYNLCDLYLPYALGGGYIISKKCSDFIVRNIGVLRQYKNEDVTVGTWLASIDHEKK
jgi:galactosylxylosylprotein 3-beta-galactosyltransferase